MRYLLFLILTSCVNMVPNEPICFMDSSVSARCAYTIEGLDFTVDNSGNNYKAQGVDWNLSQLKKYSLILPPGTWKSFKEFFLKQCHDNPRQCNKDAAEDLFKKLDGN